MLRCALTVGHPGSSRGYFYSIAGDIGQGMACPSARTSTRIMIVASTGNGLGACPMQSGGCRASSTPASKTSNKEPHPPSAAGDPPPPQSPSENKYQKTTPTGGTAAVEGGARTGTNHEKKAVNRNTTRLNSIL